MYQENIHRVLIIDKESQLVVGTITHRDILLFLIRHFKDETDEYFKLPLEVVAKDLGVKPKF